MVGQWKAEVGEWAPLVDPEGWGPIEVGALVGQWEAEVGEWAPLVGPEG